MNNYNFRKYYRRIIRFFNKKIAGAKVWQIMLLLLNFGFIYIGAISDEETTKIGNIVDTNREETTIISETVKHKKEDANVISSTVKPKNKETKVVICDGVKITKDCELDGVKYETYKYYPAKAEESHIEQERKYRQEITSYCTLCRDGTYSPSCATGRGACSHHGGVKQWNAPRYSNVAYYEDVIVIDSPAVAERYEMVEKNC